MWIRTIAILPLVGLLTTCSQEQTNADKANRAAQRTLMERATAAIPVPQVNNFLAREHLAEYMRRMDDPSKVWYVYILSDIGTIVGYHVGTYPQSVCTFMTPPEQLTRADLGSHNGHVVTTAPALDGVYYGSGGCSTSFMFDDNSDAMIFLGDVKFLAYDVPLDIDAEALKLASQPADE